MSASGTRPLVISSLSNIPYSEIEMLKPRLSCWQPVCANRSRRLSKMQLSSAFLGSKLVLRSAPAPHVNPQAPRQVTCMAKKKGVRCIVTLECTEARGLGQTPSRYTTQKVKGTAFCRLPRIVNALVTWVLKSSNKCLLAEPQKHNWQDGVEKVQQVLEASNCTQGDQVKTHNLWSHSCNLYLV